MRAVFLEDIIDIQELINYVDNYTEESLRHLAEDINVVRDVYLENNEFMETIRNLNKRRDWIRRNEGKDNGYELNVIRVNNIDTGGYFYINNEGYKYPKYVGIEV